MTENPSRLRTLLTRLSAVAVVVFLVVAVGLPTRTLGQDEEEDDESTLTGTYSVLITDEDVPGDLANGPTLIGQWRVSFNEDGTYVLFRQDVGVLGTGTYSVDGETVTITDESGLVSCAEGGVSGTPSATPGLTTGTYTWAIQDRELTLTPTEDSCEARRILLGTRPFAFFEACATAAFAGETGAEATPGSILDQLRDRPTPPTGDDEGEPATPDDPEAGIDAFLRQFTACWGTGDPLRLLPLFSQGALDEQITAAGSLDELIATLQPLLGVPFTFARAGDIEIDEDDETRATAIISFGFRDDEQFLQFDFVFEDGAWKLDSRLV